MLGFREQEIHARDFRDHQEARAGLTSLQQ